MMPKKLTLKIKHKLCVVKTCFTKRRNSVQMGNLILEYEIDIVTLRRITFRGEDTTTGERREINVEIKQDLEMAPDAVEALNKLRL